MYTLVFLQSNLMNHGFWILFHVDQEWVMLFIYLFILDQFIFILFLYIYYCYILFLYVYSLSFSSLQKVLYIKKWEENIVLYNTQTQSISFTLTLNNDLN